MASSLVADYGTSSGSDDESEDPPKPVERSVLAPPTKPVNFLTAEALSDGNSSEDEENQIEKTSETLPNSDMEPLPQLPPPCFGEIRIEDKVNVQGSIYENPFQRAEDARAQILEKHVKMTADDGLTDKKGGKRICWSFRKGKCRFGRNCKYAHDNDIVSSANVQTGDGTSDNVHDTGVSNNVTNTQGQQQQYANRSWNAQINADPEDEDSYMAQNKRRKRVGTTDTLLPPKKAREAYARQQAQEQPWIAGKH